MVLVRKLKGNYWWGAQEVNSGPEAGVQGDGKAGAGGENCLEHGDMLAKEDAREDGQDQSPPALVHSILSGTRQDVN